jgi:mRNA interferase MazF
VATIPHTTSPRDSRFEVVLPVRFLQTGAFNLQGTMAVPLAKFLRKLGSLNAEQMNQIDAALKRWLGL